MFYCTVDFQIMEDSCANVLITSRTRAGCIKYMASFVRNALSGGGQWSGASGIIRCLFLANRQGHTVYGVGAGGAQFPGGYLHEDGNEQVGYISRHWYDRCADTFDVIIFEGDEEDHVIDEEDIREDGDCYDEDKDCPDFEACADKIDAVCFA